jgi:hypothetical protein
MAHGDLWENIWQNLVIYAGGGLPVFSLCESNGEYRARIYKLLRSLGIDSASLCIENLAGTRTLCMCRVDPPGIDSR